MHNRLKHNYDIQNAVNNEYNGVNTSLTHEKKSSLSDTHHM